MSTNYAKNDKSVAINPLSAFPLDARTYFESYEDALAAAKTAKPAGSSESVYYYGMELTVFTPNKNDSTKGINTKYYIHAPEVSGGEPYLVGQAKMNYGVMNDGGVDVSSVELGGQAINKNSVALGDECVAGGRCFLLYSLYSGQPDTIVTIDCLSSSSVNITKDNSGKALGKTHAASVILHDTKGNITSSYPHGLLAASQAGTCSIRLKNTYSGLEISDLSFPGSDEGYLLIKFKKKFSEFLREEDLDLLNNSRNFQEMGWSLWFDKYPFFGTTEMNDLEPDEMDTSAVAMGINSKASNLGAVALGRGCIASGRYGVALGREAQAGYGSFAVGKSANAKATECFAIGNQSVAAENAAALGPHTHAEAEKSTAIGYGCRNFEKNSVAIGQVDNKWGTPPVKVVIAGKSQVNVLGNISQGDKSIATTGQLYDIQQSLSPKTTQVTKTTSDATLSLTNNYQYIYSNGIPTTLSIDAATLTNTGDCCELLLKPTEDKIYTISGLSGKPLPQFRGDHCEVYVFKPQYGFTYSIMFVKIIDKVVAYVIAAEV